MSIAPEEGQIVYCRWIRGKDGRRIYPKNGGVFRFVVRHPRDDR